MHDPVCEKSYFFSKDTLTAPEKRVKLEKTLSVFKKDLSNVRKKNRLTMKLKKLNLN